MNGIAIAVFAQALVTIFRMRAMFLSRVPITTVNRTLNNRTNSVAVLGQFSRVVRNRSFSTEHGVDRLS